MKTFEQVASNYESRCFDRRDLHRLIEFIPFDKLKAFGLEAKDNVTAQEWNTTIKEWTKENIIAQLEKDVAFGFEKALNQRGLSSDAMFNVVMMWNIILEDGLENYDEEKGYAQYGLPLFKATAIRYRFPNPIGEDTGKERKYASN